MRLGPPIGLLALAACGGTPPADAPSTEGAAAPTETALVVYSGRSESLVGELFKAAEADLDMSIRVEYGKTPELATRLLTEQAETPADLFFAQDSGHLGVLAKKGLLTKLDEDALNVVDGVYRGTDSMWIGTSGRLRVLVFNKETVPVDGLPKSIKDLADPAWKGKLGWAPTNGSFITHVTALRHLWGDDATKAWLEGVKANEPKTYPKNSPQVQAAHDGAIQVGWVNHYYLYRQDLATTKAANYSFPTEKDAGNLMMVSGVGVLKSSKHPEAAAKLTEWLVSEKAQNMFAQNNFEYPARTGTALHKDVPALKPDSLVVVDQEVLTDVGPTRKMLQDAGLL